MNLSNYIVPHNHEDFPVLKTSHFKIDGTIVADPTTIDYDVAVDEVSAAWRSHFNTHTTAAFLSMGTLGEVTSPPFSTNDMLFQQLHDFETALRGNVFEVDHFYGEVFDAVWKKYVEARHRAVFYGAKIGAIPHKSFNPPPPATRYLDPETRIWNYARMVPTYDHGSLMFANLEVPVIRELFYEGHGSFYDDKHRAYFAGLFRYLH